MNDFVGKVVLVTGATSGIGRATALAFAQAGASLVLSGRREPEGKETLELVRQIGGRATFVNGDVTVDADVRRLIDTALNTYGRLDAAFNNAGYLAAIGPASEQRPGDLDATLAVNVGGTLSCMRHELAVMVVAGRGAIVNNASLAGLVGSPDNAPYSASKHAIVGLTRSVALEVARSGVRVNAVCASSVETAMDEKFRAGKGITQAELAETMPMGRTCRPEEVAPAVLFLCSEGASYITGTTIVIDGGFSAR